MTAVMSCDEIALNVITPLVENDKELTAFQLARRFSNENVGPLLAEAWSCWFPTSEGKPCGKCRPCGFRESLADQLGRRSKYFSA
jgi:7-cyano-7-deazaguanine synthase in queuosine biosynthesis